MHRAAILGLLWALLVGALALPVRAPLIAAAPIVAAPDACARDPGGEGSAYVGGWVPAAVDIPGRPLAQDPLGRFNGLAGRSVSVIMRWEHWGLGGRIDTQWLRRVVAAGAFPMITWMPWNPDRPEPQEEQGYQMRDVAAGAHDAYIRQLAEDAAGWNGPLFLRFAPEMNGTWYPFGKHQNSPDDFIAAWRHVHAIFDQQGAGHVTWVWAVSEKNHPQSLALWYPGDDVVDWVAVDGYNWDDPRYWRDGRTGNTWRLLDQVFGPSFADLATFVPADKPRMIAETASTERAGDSELKAVWVCDAFRRALPEALPEVKAVLWFEEQKSEGGTPFYWPVESSAESAEAFRAALASPYYAADLGEVPGRIGRAKIPEPAVLPR